MRWKFACVGALAIFFTVACDHDHKESAEVTYISAANLFLVEDSLPAQGGTMQWFLQKPEQGQVPDFTINWQTPTPPCTPHSQKDGHGNETVTCEIPAINPGQWQRWAYTIQGTRAGVDGSGGQSPPVTVLVGHCKDCSSLKGGKSHGAQKGKLDGPYLITCANGQPTTNNPITANSGDTILWQVATGTNPTATLTFTPPSSCAETKPGSLTGSDPSCTAASSGTYTITNVPGCSGTAQPFTLTVNQ